MYTNKQIWSVSYPILLSLLAQNVINVTDTAFLGRVSEVALGASAMGGLFYICVFTIAFGFSTGSQIVIARRNGEERYTDVGPVMIQGVLFLLALALIMFGFSRAFGGDIMRLLVSSENVFNATMEFLDWRVFGFFFSVANVVFNGVSGTGNTQAALMLETITIVFYGSYIVFIGMWLKAPVEWCFTIEILYYTILLLASYIYFKKAKWQNKKI